MTIQEMEIKRWLNRAFYAEKKAKALDMLVAQCRMRAEGLSHSGECNDTGRNGSRENGTESALMKLADMELKAEAQKVEAVNVSKEIQRAISQLHDDDLEAVLIHRYILFHTIEKTAEIMGYDPRTVKRKTNKAIKKMSLYVPILM
jgi:DNA-directed RNA polymerase specialized sigma24 family protein